MKFYFGGRIAKNGWRDSILGFKKTGVDDETIKHKWPVIAIPETTHQYVGPYFISCDHGCSHIRNNHAALGYCGDENINKRTDVTRLCLEAIKECDIFFAWLEPEAYGTLVELGYAKALGKMIVVAFNDFYDFDILNAHELPSEGIHDLWFAIEQANACFNVKSPKGAFEELLRALAPKESFRDVCESPIEELLFDEFEKLAPFQRDEIGIVAKLDALEIRPQFEVGRYRLDFAIKSDDLAIAVEADGHDFHERTKEQAGRDKSRDRELVRLGWKILRFTGSEVHHNARKCVSEILSLAQSVVGP